MKPTRMWAVFSTALLVALTPARGADPIPAPDAQPKDSALEIAAPVNLGSLDRSKFPKYEWWRETFFTTGGWATVEPETVRTLLAGTKLTDFAAALNSVLKSYASETVKTVITLPAETYVVTAAIKVPSNVRLSGSIVASTVDGEPPIKTTLLLTGATAQIQLRGSSVITYPFIWIDKAALAKTPPKYEPRPYVAEPTDDLLGVSYPTGIRILKPAAANAQAVFFSPETLASTWENLRSSYPSNKSPLVFIQQIDDKAGRLAKVSGYFKTAAGALGINLDRPLSMPFTGDATLMAFLPCKNAGVENMIVERTDPSAALPMIDVLYAERCRVSNVETRFGVSEHIRVYRSDSVVVEKCVAHHSWNYGGGGRGYGVRLTAGSTRCRVAESAFYYLRHGTVIDGLSCFNVVHNNYLRSDQGAEDERVHGNFAFANLYEGNDAIDIEVDDTNSGNGDHNTLFRNRTRRIYVGGGTKNIVVGNDVVAEIAGANTNDYVRANRVNKVIEWGAGLGPVPTYVYPPSLFRTLDNKETPESLTRFGPGRGYKVGETYVEDFGERYAGPGQIMDEVPEPYRGGSTREIKIDMSKPSTTRADPGFAEWPGTVPATAKTLPVVEAADLGIYADAAIINTGDTDLTDDRVYVLISNELNKEQRVTLTYENLPDAFRDTARFDIYPATITTDDPFPAGWPASSPAQLPYLTGITASVTLGPPRGTVKALRHNIVLQPLETLYIEGRRYLKVSEPQ